MTTNQQTTAALSRRIMTDDAFVREEIARFQYLYGLKLVIRNNLNRGQTDVTESVAEHIYGMQLLAVYFLPLDGTSLDPSTVTAMILYHDAPEIEVGDIVTHQKTDADRAVEAAAVATVIERAPTGLHEHLTRHLTDYEDQGSPEARFVKAIDKLEAVLQHYDERMKPVFRELSFDLAALESSKERHIEPYPHLWRFYSVLKERYLAEGFVS